MIKYLLTLVVMVCAALACILSGSVEIPAREALSILFGRESSHTTWTYIIWQMRIPAMLTAMLTGAGLGAAGLLLQSYFRNPLAGPSILGISSGANLAVAIALLIIGQVAGMMLVGAAIIGSMLVLTILLGLSRLVRQNVTLLIVGILVSYLTSAILTLLQYQSSAEGVQSLLLWGMGSFNQVGMGQMPLFASLILLALLSSLGLIRSLNGWMLGEQYAQNLGISLGKVRWGVLFVTGLICAVTTAWCGPIAFVGLSVPHLARMICRTDNHRSLLPMSILLGACSLLLCLWISTWPDGGRTLPINAITPLFGIPIILYVLLRRK